MEDKLTEKQRFFVKEYLIDFNATRAAIAAGYSEDTAYSIASENLKKPEIQEALKEEIDERAKRVGITQDIIIRELAKIAFADINDFVEYTPDGHIVLKPSEKIDGTVLQEVSETRFGNKKIKLHDKMKALELLGKHLGMYKDVYINRPDDLSGMSDAELEAVIKKFGLGMNDKP